jgi:outer membrane protein OmpA-like peptidoglycan-associated protein
MRDFSPAPMSATCMVIVALAMSPLLLAPTPVLAQTHGDQRALDSLGPARSAHHSAAHSHHSPHHPRAASSNAAPPPAKTAAAATTAPLPTIPAAPPAPAVIKAPVINVPLHPEPPPPPVPVVAGAAGNSSTIDGGARITFGEGSADFNAGTMQALQVFATQLKANPAARAEIDAYSSGAVDDPSTPRRTSLQRGLAARAVLIHAGIPSTRIYVRAIGRPHDAAPADRVDLTRSDGAQQASSAQPAAVPTTPPGPAPVKAASAP